MTVRIWLCWPGVRQGGQFQPTSGHQVLQYESLSGWSLCEGRVVKQTKLCVLLKSLPGPELGFYLLMPLHCSKE